MKTKLSLFFIIIIILFSISCKKGEKNLLPEITIDLDVYDPNSTSIWVEINFNTDSSVIVIKKGVYYSSQHIGISSNLNDLPYFEFGKFKFDIIRDLLPNTQYYFIACIETNKGKYYSNEETLKTLRGIWTFKGMFPGKERVYSVGFSIGGKGYIALGGKEIQSDTIVKVIYLNDLWEFDPITNSWTQKADFPGLPRYRATVFVIGSKAYIGTGIGENGCLKDFWEYNPELDKWTQKACYGGGEINSAASFSILDKGYVGPSFSSFSSFPHNPKSLVRPTKINRTFWEYDPVLDRWTKKSDYIGSDSLGSYIHFSFNGLVLDNKGYILTNNTPQSEFFEYNPQSDFWLKKQNDLSIGGHTFTINGNGYSFTTCYAYEFNPNKDYWSSIGYTFDRCDHIDIRNLYTMGCFIINNKVYFCNGCSLMNRYVNDVWEYIATE